MSRKAKMTLNVSLIVAAVAALSVVAVFTYRAYACEGGPVAILYPSDQTIYVDGSAFLDGSASYDTGGNDITKYTFAFDDGTSDYSESEGDASDGAFDGETDHTYGCTCLASPAPTESERDAGLAS